MAGVKGVRAQSTFSTNREHLNFAEGIALLDPNENPFTLMAMKFGKKTTGNMKHSWFEDVLVSEVDTADTVASTVTTDIGVDNIDRWAVGDIGMLEASREVVLVTVVSSGTGAATLTAVRNYGATSGAYTPISVAITDGLDITIIGNAFEQGHALPTLKSTTEVQMNNWCQDVRTPFGLTEIAAAAAVRGEADWPYQMRKSGISHMRKLDWMAMFGRPMPGAGTLYATLNNEPSTSGGMWHFLTGGTGFSGTGSDRLAEQAVLTKAEFLTWVRHAFQYGSRDKVAFVSGIFREQLDTWGISDLQTFTDTKVYGIDVGKWVSSHGTIAFVTHKMLDGHTGLGGMCFLIDMAEVKFVTYSNIGSTRLRTLKPYEADGSTVKKAEFQTIATLEVKNPEKHACLYGMTSVTTT